MKISKKLPANTIYDNVAWPELEWIADIKLCMFGNAYFFDLLLND